MAVCDDSFGDREVDLKPGDVGNLPPKGFEGNFGREIYPPRDLRVILADCFEDRSDFGGFAGGSKAVFDDSFEDRSDFGGFDPRFESLELRRPRKHFV